MRLMADRPPRPGLQKAVAAGVGRVADQFPDDLIDRPTRRRAGVFRRALRREVSRLHDPHRIAAIVIFIVVGGILAAGLIARGEAAAQMRGPTGPASDLAQWRGPVPSNGRVPPYVYPP
jgi:hypothetical protein